LVAVAGRSDVRMMDTLMEKLAVGGAGLKRLALLEEGEVEVDEERLVLTLERRKMLR
jgi:hypothetical protein